MKHAISYLVTKVSSKPATSLDEWLTSHHTPHHSTHTTHHTTPHTPHHSHTTSLHTYYLGCGEPPKKVSITPTGKVRRRRRTKAEMEQATVDNSSQKSEDATEVCLGNMFACYSIYLL